MTNRRFYISSRTMTAAEAATAIRAHWAIETSLYWVRDVAFGEAPPETAPDATSPTWPSPDTSHSICRE